MSRINFCLVTKKKEKQLTDLGDLLLVMASSSGFKMLYYAPAQLVVASRSVKAYRDAAQPHEMAFLGT